MIHLNNLTPTSFTGTRTINGKEEKTDATFDTKQLFDNLVVPTSDILKEATCSLGNDKLAVSDVLELSLEGDAKKIISYNTENETFTFEDPLKDEVITISKNEHQDNQNFQSIFEMAVTQIKEFFS